MLLLFAGDVQNTDQLPIVIKEWAGRTADKAVMLYKMLIANHRDGFGFD